MLTTAEAIESADRSAPPLGEVLDALGESTAPEVIETPMSWVILTDRHAFKLKKAVDSGEARFSSPVYRRQSCMEEVWRNERLAPGVYLGVVALTRGRDGVLRLGSKGADVEWLVKMRRLQADRNLHSLLRHRQVCRTQVGSLARAVTEFYLGEAPQPDQVDELCARIQRRINDNARALIERLPTKAGNTVRRIREIQRDYLNSSRAVLRVRVCDGRIVDGHGELLPEHIFLERRPVIVGCVDYSAQRRKLDALDDLGLLAMECEHLGRDDIADEVMATYRASANDDGFPHLEAFYKSLHACRRAANACRASHDEVQRMSRDATDEATSYLDQAEHYVSNLV